MAAYDTDYDSDTSNEAEQRPIGQKCKELEMVQMALEDVMAHMQRVKKYIQDLDDVHINPTERNIVALRNVRFQLLDIENDAYKGRLSLRSMMPECSCDDCETSCVGCLYCATSK